MTIINYAANGNQRKKLVNALVEILGCESEYLKAPSYAYQIGEFVVNRDGNIECPDGATEEEIETLIKKLTWQGFERILDESITDATEEEIAEVAKDAESISTDEDTASEVLVEDNVIIDESNVPESIAEEVFDGLDTQVLPEGSFESDEVIEENVAEEPIWDNTAETALSEILDNFEESEEDSDTSESNRIVIELPGSYLSESELGRVRSIVASKASVLKKALETDDLSIERKDDKIIFPWFTDHKIDGEAKAYMQLVSGIAKRAKMLTRVTATENVSDNDKFTMRLFLVSLDFKGEEYKFARKFLLRNLSGNSSWRTEDAKARHDARKVHQEIEAPAATINHSSEGGDSCADVS